MVPVAMAKQIYKDWVVSAPGARIKSLDSCTVDTRAALVEYFRGQGRIIIATGKIDI